MTCTIIIPFQQLIRLKRNYFNKIKNGYSQAVQGNGDTVPHNLNLPTGWR